MEVRERKNFWKLWAVFFFQGMAGGFWIPVLTNILNKQGNGIWVGAAFAVLPICSLLTPLVFGALADERFSAQKLYGWISLIAAATLAVAFAFLDFHLPPLWFICGLTAYGLAAGPCWGLITNIGLTSLNDPEKRFPLIRIGATFGWVGAGFLTSYVLDADSSPVAGYAAGASHLIAGLIGFSLPHTPPLGKGKSWKSALGLGGFALFKNRDHAVLFCITGLFSIPLAAFYMYSPELFKALGDKSPAASMTIGQASEVLAMLVLGSLMLKYRLKTLLMWGLGLSVLRFGLSGYAGLSGEVGWHLAGVGLHGVCYSFYFVTAQVYLSRRVAPGLRGQAQGLLSLVTSGIGTLLGSFICAALRRHLVDENGVGWQNFWWVLSGIIAACWVAFAILYRGRKTGE